VTSVRFLIVLLAALLPASAGLAQKSASGLAGPQSNVSGGTLQIAPNTLAWQAGAPQSTFGPDCLDIVNGGFINGFMWVADYGDPSVSPPIPKVGDVYYTYVFAGNVSACQFPAM
jgi:hypothetical protein